MLAIGAAAIGVLVVPRLPRGDPAATAAVAGRMRSRPPWSAPRGRRHRRHRAARRRRRRAGPRLGGRGAGRPGPADLRALHPGTAAAFVYASYGYATGRVWASGLSTFLYAGAWLGLLFVAAFTGNAEDAALAGVAATAVQLLAAFAISSAGLPRPWPSFRGLGIGPTALGAIGAVLATAIVARAGILLDPLFGSLLPEGSVSQLSYAARIAALAIFACGQGAAYSLLIVGRESSAGAADESRVGLLSSLLFSTSAAAVLLAAGPELCELVLARGELTVSAAREIGELLRLWAPAVIAFTMVWSLEALLYAELRTGAVLHRALAGLAVNAAASGLLVLALGIEGRPLGALAGVVVQLALLLLLLRDDERVAGLLAAKPARLALLHAAVIAAVTAVAFLPLDAAGLPALGACLAILLDGCVSLFFVRSYQRTLAATAEPAPDPGGSRA